MPYRREIDSRWSFKGVNTKEFTHGYHTYPAMMIPQIVRTLIEEYAPADGCLNHIFDPYMGSGTTLVEAAVMGIDSSGTDLNPLARLMSRVKTTHYDEMTISLQFERILSQFPSYDESRVVNRNFERVSNHSYWYSDEVLLKLSFIEQLIEQYAGGCDFFMLVLAEVVRETSYTRNGEFKRFRMSADKIALFKPDPFALFERKAQRNIEGLHMFNHFARRANVEIFDFNSALGINSDKISMVDMVITSPPYGDSRTTVAYGQFSRWANEWFGFEDAKCLDNKLMGGGKSHQLEFNSREIAETLNAIRSLDEKRYWDVVSFLNDYSRSICQVATTVRLGGRVCYVVGDRRVKGIQIPLDYFTAEIFEQKGFAHIKTIVREIPNKRMPALTSPTNRAGDCVQTMSHEYIVIMERVK